MSDVPDGTLAEKVSDCAGRRARRLERAVPALRHHDQGCPTFRDFRKVGTTDLDLLLMPNLRSLEVRMKTEAPSAQSGHHRPWCPHFESREVWGSPFLCGYKQKSISGPASPPMKILLGVLLLCGFAFAADEPSLDQCLADPSHAAYRIFQTKNIWTFLKLDTRSGLIWQVQWGENPVSVPVNKLPLTKPEQAQAGRFTLCATRNIYNFILLDQDSGRIWDVQWSMDDKERSIAILP